MKLAAVLFLGICASGICGCGNYKADVQSICNAPALTAKKMEVKSMDDLDMMDPSQKSRVMADVVEGKLKTSEGRAFFKSLAGIPPTEKADKMDAEASRAGIQSCAWASWYRAQSSPPPKPLH